MDPGSEIRDAKKSQLGIRISIPTLVTSMPSSAPAFDTAVDTLL